jgi:hypothetical protein
LGVLFAVFAVILSCASCGTSKPTGSAALTRPSTEVGPTRPTSLPAPKTTAAQDNLYLADVAKADSALAAYIQQQGDTALRALLTDGSAFCAFLSRGGGIDDAIVDVAVGAKSIESQTHLPDNVTTFNTMEAVALLTLCPSEQRLVPASVQSKLRVLGHSLAQ